MHILSILETLFTLFGSLSGKKCAKSQSITKSIITVEKTESSATRETSHVGTSQYCFEQ